MSYYCVREQRDPDRNPGNEPCIDQDKCHLCGKTLNQGTPRPTPRGYSDSEKEFLLDFAASVKEPDELFLKQLRALWTAYCFHKDIVPDTLRFDEGLKEIWQKLEEKGRGIPHTMEFEEFDLYMGKLFC